MNPTSAPPLEAISAPTSILKEKQANDIIMIDNNINNIPSRCSSISTTSSSSLSATAASSLSSLSLKSISTSNSNQNINISDNNNTATTTTTNLRRSKRVERKRKLNQYQTFYTPKQWSFCYSPPNKKRKTNNNNNNLPSLPSSPVSSVSSTSTSLSSPSSTPTPSTTTSSASSSPASSVSVSPSPQSVISTKRNKLLSSQLRIQNNLMKKVKNSVLKKQTNWIKYHYNAFEPFLTPSIRAKFKPSSSENIQLSPCRVLTSQPDTLCFGELRDYQLLSLNWLRSLRNNGCPAILADEMGLGKTIQSIACISSFYLDKFGCNLNNRVSPSLVICPLSVAEAWLTEFTRWLPSLRVVLFHGGKLQREQIMKNKLIYGSFDVVITTYEIVISSKQWFNRYYWNYLILDEAHKIKNENTNWHIQLKQINSKSIYCVLLTGTPIQNNMHELYALLSFIFPNLFVESYIFDACYQTQSNNMIQDRNLLSKAPYLLHPFFLRRLKEEVELTLPPKEEIIIKINMSLQQKKYYKMFLSAYSSLIDDISDTLYGGNKIKAKNTVSQWKKVRQIFMELRKIALHPFLLSNLTHLISIKNGESLISHSSKLQLLDKLLDKLINTESHRVLIFSCFTLILDLLEIYCSYRGYKYLRLDGSTSRLRRKIDIMRFNDDPNSPFVIYLISNRAGGLGINLQSADTVIHFDTDWNPQADLQAQARAHRIGQKNMVKIYRIITSDTVEERILFRSQQKLYLDAVVNKGAKMLQDNNSSFDLNNQDLLQSIKFGAQKMFENNNDDIDNIDNIDLDLLLQRSYKIGNNKSDKSDNKSDERQKLLKDLSEQNNVANFNFSMKLVAGNVFEGKEYKKKDFKIDADIDYTKIKRNADGSKTRKVRELVVDGLRFTSKIQQNPLTKFYINSSKDIYDVKNVSPFHHETERCWGCDAYINNKYLNNINKIIKCQSCPKVFHNNNKCWHGIKTRMGIYLCSQHQCFKCNMKTSECGMILRCLGCQMSFCYDCSPNPYFINKKDNNNNNDDGLFFVDECSIAKHYNYYLPRAAYMYIFCSKQCKTFYNFNYIKRSLPDLSLKYKDLPNKIKYIIEKDNNNDACKLNDISIDSRIAEYDMAYKIIDRLKQNIDGNTPLIAELYNILYEINDDDDDDNDDIANMGSEKEEKDYIRDIHYLPLFRNELKTSEILTNILVPQWIQCVKCKKWRTTNIKLSDIFKWKKQSLYLNWNCSLNADDFNCNSIQNIPSKKTHNQNDLNILRYQRELMNIQYHILYNNNNDKLKEKEYKNNKKKIIKKINNLINEYREKNLIKLFRTKIKDSSIIINDSHIASARYLGLSSWNGINILSISSLRLCKYYSYLISSFRHWRIESLKTLMDHLGFLIETKKKNKKGSLHPYHIDKVSLSYNKDKVIEALALFLINPNNKYLILTTKYFSKK